MEFQHCWFLDISFTNPKAPFTSMKSPILKGLNSKIRTPLAKFPKRICSAKPMANPMAPRIATKEVVAISSIPATDINSKAFNKKATIVVKNG